MFLANVVLITFESKMCFSCLAASLENFEGAFKFLVVRSLLRLYSVDNGFNVFKMGSVELEFSKAVKSIISCSPSLSSESFEGKQML